MKILNNYLLPILILWITLGELSCKKRDIKGEVVTIGNVEAFFNSDEGKVVVPEDTNYTVSARELTVSLRTSFSDVVTKRFDMAVRVDNDTINHMIAQNKLPNTILLPAGSYKVPSSLDVLYGLEHLDFDLKIDIQVLEKNYGKTLAVALELVSPSKGNKLDKNKKEVIVLINTSEVLNPKDIHYIYFSGAGNIAKLPEQGETYSQTATSLNVPVEVTLAGEATGPFQVDVSSTDSDTIQNLIDDGTLTNVVLLKEGTDYTLPASLNFNAGENTGALDLKLNSAMLENNAGNKLALALTLQNTDDHLIDSTRSTLIVVIEDPAKLIEAVKYLPVQTPIIITGFLANPRGYDQKIPGETTSYANGTVIHHKGGYEYIQLMALEDIDFSETPYSVVTCNNGTATENGWAEGGTRTFKFDLTEGFAAKGTFFYVGSPSKVICAYWEEGLSTDISDANWIRTIAVQSAQADSITGDGFGLQNSSFLGNSSPADGIAVFSGTEVTPTTVPLDAIFFNPPAGAALNGSNGYLIPKSDLYNPENPETGEPQPLFGEGSNTAAVVGAGEDNHFAILGGVISDDGWIIPRNPSTLILSRTSQLEDIESGPGVTVYKK